MIFTTKCKILKVVLAILVVVTITMATNIRTYDSAVLKQIQDQSKLKDNHCFFSLEPKTRSKIISLGIRARLRLSEDWGEENAYSIGYILLSTINATIHKPGWGIDKSYFALPNKQFIMETHSSNHYTMANCRTIVNKTQTIQVDIATHNIDLCAPTETLIKQEDNTTILACCPPNLQSLLNA